MPLTLMRLAHLLRSAFMDRMQAQPWVAESGMRPPGFGALRIIAGHGPVSQREVAELLGLHPSDLVSLVDMLEANGWVRRDRSEADRRRYDLTLTDDGRRALDRFETLALAAEEQILGVLSARERSSLEAILTKLAAAHFDGSCAPTPAASGT